MKHLTSLVIATLVVSLPGVTSARQASGRAMERFEVTSMKAVRPTLTNTLAAVQRKDAAAAKAAFEDYDSGWNGIEVYINTRNPDLYKELELTLQARITEALNAASPNFAALVPDVQAMIAKYDEAISASEKGAPLNPLYDDVARLRIVRAHLREVSPALKAGNIAKARKSFDTFDEKWDSIEDLVKVRSQDAYVAIEGGMMKIEQSFASAKPDTAELTTLVAGVMDKYNGIVSQVTREARAAK
jgi:hypothetical protein